MHTFSDAELRIFIFFNYFSYNFYFKFWNCDIFVWKSVKKTCYSIFLSDTRETIQIYVLLCQWPGLPAHYNSTTLSITRDLWVQSLKTQLHDKVNGIDECLGFYFCFVTHACLDFSPLDCPWRLVHLSQSKCLVLFVIIYIYIVISIWCDWNKIIGRSQHGIKKTRIMFENEET